VSIAYGSRVGETLVTAAKKSVNGTCTTVTLVNAQLLTTSEAWEGDQKGQRERTSCNGRSSEVTPMPAFERSLLSVREEYCEWV
jgi:hypothetical protein